tara:strand:+ start:1438 stop:1893 length:456 start_codon:yes stop_codon:yes gene_type:complete
MVTTILIGPYEECDEELITMEEFMNKMRSFNSYERNELYPRDPHKYVYKIEVNNIFKRVHLVKAFEIIEHKFEEHIRSNWNEAGFPTEEILLARTDDLLNRCLYDDNLKRKVFNAIHESGQYDDEESEHEETEDGESEHEESEHEESEFQE